jgi:hypothetical protein
VTEPLDWGRDWGLEPPRDLGLSSPGPEGPPRSSAGPQSNSETCYTGQHLHLSGGGGGCRVSVDGVSEWKLLVCNGESGQTEIKT